MRLLLIGGREMRPLFEIKFILKGVFELWNF
nr:MAG TPA: hypothetical protein [Caudoviricetes sp.]